jgi:hypothetical protein
MNTAGNTVGETVLRCGPAELGSWRSVVAVGDEELRAGRSGVEVVDGIPREGRAVRTGPRMLNVAVAVTVPWPLSLNVPVSVNLPAVLGRLGSSNGTALKVPVSVNTTWIRPSAKDV